MKRVSILLITVAFIAGIISCATAQYTLTISSTEGCSVITPGEGTFTYSAGTVVELVAMPEEGYSFVKWTGDVSFIDDVHAAATTITMNGSYDIMMESVKDGSIQIVIEYATLDDEGGSVTHPGEG